MTKNRNKKFVLNNGTRRKLRYNNYGRAANAVWGTSDYIFERKGVSRDG